MPISTEFGMKHPLVLGIQICLYKETHNREIVKIIHTHLKSFHSRAIGPFPSKLGKKKSSGHRKLIFYVKDNDLHRGSMISK